jgi:hypothetical protein
MRLRGEAEAVRRREKETAARPEHAVRFREGLLLVANVLNHVARDQRGEPLRRQWQALGARAGEGNTRQPFLVETLPRDDQPPHRDIDTATLPYLMSGAR